MADASVSLDLDAQQLYQELQNVQSHFAQFASKATQEGEKAAKGFTSGFSLGTTGQNLLGGLAGLGLGTEIKAVVEYGAKIEDLSRRFGVGTETLQRFGNAAELNGSSLEAVARGFRFLEVNQAKALGGSEAMTKAFAELGVSTEDLKSLRPEDIALKIGQSSLNAADFVKVFGKSAIELRPLLAGLADGTIQFGNAINDLDVKNLKEADDKLKSIHQTLTIFVGGLLGEAAAGLKILFSKDENKQIGENAKAQEEALLRTRYLANPPPAASTGRDFSHPAGEESESGESDDQGRDVGGKGRGKNKESLQDQIADLEAKKQGDSVLARKKIQDEFAKDSGDVRERLESGDYSSFTDRAKDKDSLANLEKRRDLKLSELDKKDSKKDSEKDPRGAREKEQNALKGKPFSPEEQKILDLAQRKTPEDNLREAAEAKAKLLGRVDLQKQEGEERYKLSRPDLFPNEHRELQNRAQQIRHAHEGKSQGNEIKAPKMEQLLEAIKTNTEGIGANK